MSDVQIGIIIILTLQFIINCFLLLRCNQNAKAITILADIAKGQTDIIKAHQKKFDEAIECV